MLFIPYEKQIDPSACALASCTMVARYFFPETTKEEMLKIAGWIPNFAVWEFKFWTWIMERGIHVETYDPIDYRAWAENGFDGLKNSISKKEFDFYVAHTKNIESYQKDIQRVLADNNFTHYKAKPTFETLRKALAENRVCTVVLNSKGLHGKEGFVLHAVVVLEANNDRVIYHDPNEGQRQEVSRERFIHAWLETVDQSSLTIYTGIKTKRFQSKGVLN